MEKGLTQGIHTDRARGCYSRLLHHGIHTVCSLNLIDSTQTDCLQLGFIEAPSTLMCSENVEFSLHLKVLRKLLVHQSFSRAFRPVDTKTLEHAGTLRGNVTTVMCACRKWTRPRCLRYSGVSVFLHSAAGVFERMLL